MPGFEDLWFNELSRMDSDREDFLHTALRKAGWQYDSQTPGSYWMWKKNINGTMFCVDERTAKRIQEHFDRRAYFEKYPDELGD